jgi:hypothetical protein
LEHPLELFKKKFRLPRFKSIESSREIAHMQVGQCGNQEAASRRVFVPQAQDNARHRLKHAATRLPPAGPPEADAEFFSAGANGTDMRQRWSARRKATANDSNSSKVLRREG